MIWKLFRRKAKKPNNESVEELDRFYSQEFYPYVAGRKRKKVKPYDFGSFVESFIATPYIYACINKKATAIKTLEPKTLRITSDGESFVDYNNELYKLIRKPNPYYSFRILLEGTVESLELTGNAYWELNKTKTGKVLSIYLLQPHRMFIKQDGPNSFKYVYRLPNGKEIIYEQDEIIHFKYQNPFDDLYGLSPMASLDLPVETLQESLDILNKYFKYGTHLRGVLETDNILTKEMKTYLENRWAQFYASSSNAFKIPILEKGLKFRPINVVPKDMQAIEAHEKALYAILAVFKVPPEVLGLRQANYSGMEQARRSFWEDTIIPLAKDLEDTINFNLHKIVKNENLKFVLDYSGVEALKENKLVRARVAGILMDRGVMTRNEVRVHFFDLPPVEGGDEFLLPLNMTPVEPGRKPENEEGNPDQTLKPDSEAADNSAKFFETKTVYQSEADWLLIHSVVENYFINELPKYYSQQKDRFKEKLLSSISAMIIVSESKLEKEINAALRYARTLTAEEIVEKFMSIAERLYFDIKRQINPDLSVLTGELPKNIRKIITDWAYQITDIIDETTRKQLINHITKAIQSEQSLEHAIDHVYNKLVNDVVGQRIRLIARTETTYLLNRINLEIHKEAGYKMKKWNCVLDEKTRPEHAALDGKKIPIDEKFDVGGYKADHPGDKSLPANLSINCRCWLTFHQR